MLFFSGGLGESMDIIQAAFETLLEEVIFDPNSISKIFGQLCPQVPEIL